MTVFPGVAPGQRAARRLLVTLGLGELPEHLPSLYSCKRYGAAMAATIDGGPLDRLLRHHGGAARCARLHSARTSRSERPGVAGALRYDDLEQLSGTARVVRVEVAEDAAVPTLVDALSQLVNVERVVPDYLCATPFDLRAGALELTESQIDEHEAWWPRELIHLPEALGYEPGDPSVIVGLADTGVAEDHTELAGRLRQGFDTVDLDSGTVGSLTLVGDNRARDEAPDDEVGHGTACAGILRATGSRLPPGGAGLCGLTPVRVLGAALSGKKRVGIGALSNIDAGMKRLIDLGVKVVNMSFGTQASVLRPVDPRPHEEIVRYAQARGVILVAASGNSGLEEAYFPAAHDGVIAVGAVDRRLRPCTFSTRGPHVALAAPGHEVWTSGLKGYERATGTSFAAPFVSAVCALMTARAERRAQPLSPQLAKAVLIESVQPFGASGVTGCGAGVLDALAALRALERRLDELDAADT